MVTIVKIESGLKSMQARSIGSQMGLYLGKWTFVMKAMPSGQTFIAGLVFSLIYGPGVICSVFNSDMIISELSSD